MPPIKHRLKTVAQGVRYSIRSFLSFGRNVFCVEFAHYCRAHLVVSLSKAITIMLIMTITETFMLVWWKIATRVISDRGGQKSTTRRMRAIERRRAVRICLRKIGKIIYHLRIVKIKWWLEEFSIIIFVSGQIKDSLRSFTSSPGLFELKFYIIIIWSIVHYDNSSFDRRNYKETDQKFDVADILNKDWIKILNCLFHLFWPLKTGSVILKLHFKMQTRWLHFWCYNQRDPV